MLTLILFLAVAALLTYAVIIAEANMPAPALTGEWRDGDVLTRQRSTVDAVTARASTSGELLAQADTLRELVRNGVGVGEITPQAACRAWAYAGLLTDLAERRTVELALEQERLRHARDMRAVRAVYRVAL